MPSLASRGTNVVDLSGYAPVETTPPASTGAVPSTNQEPGLNVFLRCPLPPIWNTPPDSLRQFYQNGLVPQVRLFNPPVATGGGGNTTVNTFVSGSSSSNGGGTQTGLSIIQTSIKTSSINSGSKFTGSLVISKAFQLMTVTASSPCRIQLYGTAQEQAADAYRGLDVPPPAGTGQNIICDVVLDTAPFQWTFQDRVGGNGNSPQTSTIYITITNIDVTSDVINVTFGYVPIVS
jgi:hypothetical protein